MGCSMRQANISLYAPFFITWIFPPPASSERVPRRRTVKPCPLVHWCFKVSHVDKNAAMALVAIILRPYPCPIPGSASYSALNATTLLQSYQYTQSTKKFLTHRHSTEPCILQPQRLSDIAQILLCDLYSLKSKLGFIQI
jgi:hypothetical protein